MEETIAAISTAMGEGGIGIVRMSGRSAHNIGKSAFQQFNKQTKGLETIEHRKLYYGYIADGQMLLDEVLICFMKAPHTYTKEDMVEVYTHGGMMSVRRVLQLLLRKGCRLAEPGEFTKRAFLNGRLDLSQAEAVVDLIKAKTEKSYQQSLCQLEGSLAQRIKQIRGDLLKMLAYVEMSINFNEDGQEELDRDQLVGWGKKVIADLSKLLQSANQGKIVREGIQTTILGKPNVGKSSLLNALLQENRAIVTDIPGTTRDIIEEYIQLGGIALKLVDTAGIRETSDLVEQIGVTKTLESLQKADLIIAILDSSQPLDYQDREILRLIEGKKAILLINKVDINHFISKEELKKYGDFPIIETSLLRGQGLTELEEAILSMFQMGEISPDSQVMLANLRHQHIVERSLQHINTAVYDMMQNIHLECIEIDLRQSWQILGEITGETVQEDILDKIFSEFCIGK